MNRHLIYFSITITLAFTLLSTTIELFNSAMGQVDPSQEQIEPIPPSNISNTNPPTPIVLSQEQIL